MLESASWKVQKHLIALSITSVMIICLTGSSRRYPVSDLLNICAQESLRNRHFPGFRISNTHPTTQQLATAYKKEVIDRHNGQLASSLCASWIRQHPLLATAALKSLGIESENPADANSWINLVHAKLDLKPNDDVFRKLTRDLATQFSTDDVHIFVSLVSYGTDQQILRKLVDDELFNPATDSQSVKEQVERDLQTAKAKLKDIEVSNQELERNLQTELTHSRETLDAKLREHYEISSRPNKRKHWFKT